MSLTLYLHPLASFCHKALIALYENSTPFTPRQVNLGDPASRDELARVWPITRFPVLRDAARNRTLPESSIIIEYLDIHYPGPRRLIPGDPVAALEVRAIDRFYDLHVHEPMQKIVGDKLRPAGSQDPTGVENARARLRTALGLAEESMKSKEWAAGAEFSLADCAAAPPLFFIDRMSPLSKDFPALAEYLGRCKQRPSYARALAEAEPYLHLFPG